jgi:MerR family copper efflux transcriptional regulator
MMIGELAKRAGVNPQTIRYYEREGILPPPRRRAGSDYREYGEDALRQLRFIKQAQAAGLTLGQIVEILHARISPRSCGEVEAVIQRRLAEIRGKMLEFHAFERSLERLRGQCVSAGGRRACPALTLLGEA